MKKKITILLFLLIGCSSNTLQDRLNGIWKYSNDNNEYAEIWFDKSHILMVDETSYNMEMFNYTFINDSIVLKSIANDETIYKLKCILKKDSNLILANKFVQYELERIGDILEIDTSLIGDKHFYEEFRERMIEHKE